MSSGQRRSCCSLPGLPHHPGEICLAADSLFSRDEWLSRPSHRPGPGLPPSPTPFCFAADSLFSRDEWLSRPSHRPGPGLPPSPTPFCFAADDDSIAMPDADSAVPQSPVSGNVPSARGLALVGSGTGSTARLGGMFRRISFMPSGSLFPVARAETNPSSTLPTVLLCIRAVHIPPSVVMSGASRRHSGRCRRAPSQLA